MVPQIPWIERKFSFDFPVTMFPVIYSRLEGTMFRIEKLLENATDEECCRCEGSWCIKEQIGHLTDLEALLWQRLEDFKEGKDTLTAADMSNRKTYEARHKETALTELLHNFRIERQTILDYIYHFDAAMLERTAMHPRLEKPMRLIDALFFVAEHDDHHLSTISLLLRVENIQPISHI